jgi:hypothetical protein
MAIASDTGGGTPFAKFKNLGDTLIGAHASRPRDCVREKRKYGTNEVELKADGKTPKKEEVLWLVAMPGTTAHVGNLEKGDLTPIEPMDLVKFTVDGFKWGQVIQARQELPAANGFKLGQTASGDVYTITLVGWSTATDNPKAAEAAGFTVVDGRIILRTEEERERYILAKVRQGGGNTNVGNDFEITIRRPGPADKAYEQEADRHFLAEPWKQRSTVSVGGGHDTGDQSDDEPF